MNWIMDGLIQKGADEISRFLIGTTYCFTRLLKLQAARPHSGQTSVEFEFCVVFRYNTLGGKRLRVVGLSGRVTPAVDRHRINRGSDKA